jgi:signal transduction histidine kinase
MALPFDQNTMKRQISLKWFFALAMLSLGTILVIGYSVLSALYFMRGMDNIMSANMETAIEHFVKSVPSVRYAQSNDFDGYQISSRWEKLPQSVREGFGEPPTQVGVLQKHDASGLLAPPDVIHFLMRFHADGEDLLISQTLTRASASPMVGHNFSRNMQALWMISAVSALAIALIIWLLIKRVSRPAAELGAWAQSLDGENYDQTVPDFGYPELNRLAALVRNSISSVHQAVKREHRFLRYASHELRTPISVIRNNIELIDKIEQGQQNQITQALQQAHGRIDRASLTMQHMTETLLWLSRDEQEPLPTQKIHIGGLIELLVNEMRYLLEDKHVDVDVQTDALICELPSAAVRIVLGNLIRNAFQHTWNGHVSIKQQGNRIRIENRSTDTKESNDFEATGFGLGLQLTEQLTKQLGWYYHNEPVNNSRVVKINL